MAKFANFEVHVEIEKLKIHVKGDREIAPEVANNVAQQISAVFQPAGLIEAPKDGKNGHHVIDATPAVPTRRTRRRASTSTPASDSTTTINWTHDAAKWGTPLQAWKQPQKINWLLYVAEQETGKAEMTPTEIVEVFQAKFKAAGLLHRQNIAKNLGNNADLFGNVDGRWFLKQGGKDAAAKLIAEAKAGKITARTNARHESYSYRPVGPTVGQPTGRTFGGRIHIAGEAVHTARLGTEHT